MFPNKYSSIAKIVVELNDGSKFEIVGKEAEEFAHAIDCGARKYVMEQVKTFGEVKTRFTWRKVDVER